MVCGMTNRHPGGRTCRDPITLMIVLALMPYALARLAFDTITENRSTGMGKHKDALGTGSKSQRPGKRRGVETGNGYSASTGHGKPTGVTFQGTVSQAKVSRLRVIGDVFRGKHAR